MLQLRFTAMVTYSFHLYSRSSKSFHSVFHSFHGLMNSINWPASSVWVFIAQLGEHCSANAEATGSNPVEAPKIFFFFFGLFSQLLQLRFTAMVTYSFHLYSRSSKSFHSVFHSFHGLMNSINWPASSVWVFIAQLGEHCSANAEATGSSPVEAPKTFFFFFRAIFAIASIAIHCDGHILISFVFPQFKIISFSVSFLSRVDELNKLASLQCMGLHSSAGRALQR